MRLHTLIPAAASAFLALFCGLSQAAPPNIVLVITDDQGYGDLGVTGNPVLQTPHIDALAAKSSQLTDYHVGPTCSPTRTALLTGHWTERTDPFARATRVLITNRTTNQP